MSRLQLEGISHHFDDDGLATLTDIVLPVDDGEMLAIVGPSGSGKSTLIRVTSGLADPTAGRILVDDVDVTGLPAEQRGLTVMFQQPHLFTHLSVLDNVAFGPRLRGASRREAREVAGRYLALVHLEGLGGRRTRQLSGGQQQRVALARALATERGVLLLDEPFSALDAGLRASMHALLREVRAALSPTILMVTHDLDEAGLADRAAVLVEGRVHQVGAVPALYRRPASVAVARLLGGFNEIPGQLEGGRHVSSWGSVEIPAEVVASGSATLLLRREQMLLEPPGEHPASDQDIAVRGLTVRVTSVGTAGPRQVAVVELRPLPATQSPDRARLRVEVELPVGQEVSPGQDLNLRLDPRHPIWAVPGPDSGQMAEGVRTW